MRHKQYPFGKNKYSCSLSNLSLKEVYSLTDVSSDTSKALINSYDRMGQEIREAILNARQSARDNMAAAAAPKAAITCPWCGATTMPDASGCCEYCGGAVGR